MNIPEEDVYERAESDHHYWFDEAQRLRKAVTEAMELLSNGDTEGGAKVLRNCFWGVKP